MSNNDSQQPQICDYEGSNYRTDFWENKNRDYEDGVERVALQRLLPTQGRRLLEIGAGFGRLSNEYDAFDQVVVMDYSFSQLEYAQEHLGAGGRYLFVAADAYQLPFQRGVFDGATMIRVIHHMADVPKVLGQVAKVLAPQATFILEHANKQNLKAMLRYQLKKQSWNPYDRDPVEFVALNFDFHPEYIKDALEEVGFWLEQRIPVSFFRLNALKDNIPAPALVGLDRVLQYSGMLYSPSIFIRSQMAQSPNPDNVSLDASAIFANPETGTPLVREGDTMRCPESGQRWAIRNGIYDFKAPIS
jgi:SAM-dependent methyltransferase